MSQLVWRSIFISDVHMGTKSCKADYLLNFLRATSSEKLYLVGDIFDLWAMKKSVYWSKPQTEILKEIFAKAKAGTDVIYIPGNHDSFFRDFTDNKIKGISIKQDAIHETPDGKQFFVSHGDEFDLAVKHNVILKFIGNHAYDVLLWLNHVNTRFRRYFKLPYWSLSSHLKSQVKNANKYINKYKQAALHKAAHDGFDGYICGHIHKAGISSSENTLYCNTGDWVEHCTALVEDQAGVLQILHWSDHAKIEITHRDEEVILADIPLLLPEFAKSA